MVIKYYGKIRKYINACAKICSVERFFNFPFLHFIKSGTTLLKNIGKINKKLNKNIIKYNII
ncbi:hypothetical protein PFNF135_00228 [Plasmodium falciparum NF135/5.C10]|uniref:Uncharacterized protein n=1 Tax=Plasmodium falciparum NF135/5.C10 TaxID=1036726 RepID=W4IPH0_PLAFA|nr:hypothetical protein PFNF135_00228 [Plasmodium falciparum NF135/5.C10]